jgi:hypothetical protein
MRSARSPKALVWTESIAQPIIRREQASLTARRYTKLSSVRRSCRAHKNTFPQNPRMLLRQV